MYSVRHAHSSSAAHERDQKLLLRSYASLHRVLRSALTSPTGDSLDSASGVAASALAERGLPPSPSPSLSLSRSCCGNAVPGCESAVLRRDPSYLPAIHSVARADGRRLGPCVWLPPTLTLSSSLSPGAKSRKRFVWDSCEGRVGRGGGRLDGVGGSAADTASSASSGGRRKCPSVLGETGRPREDRVVRCSVSTRRGPGRGGRGGGAGGDPLSPCVSPAEGKAWTLSAPSPSPSPSCTASSSSCSCSCLP